MAYICLTCYTIFDDMVEEKLAERIKPAARCTNKACKGKILQIDDCLTDVIIELNKKGYRTFMCCQGHSYDDRPDTHIGFYTLHDMPGKAPKEFSVETPNPIVNIFRKRYPENL